MKIDWNACKKRYERELFDSVVPFWEFNCPDEDFGGYYTFLDRDGKVFDTNKFMWMQWRIVYTFANLATTDSYSSEKLEKYRCNPHRWLDLSRHGFDFLEDNGKDENNQYYFALNQKGDPIVAPYNIYSQAFAVMGSAALFKATREEKYKREAILAMEGYVARMDNPKGKWEKSLPAAPQRKNLGHYMILANLAQVLKDCVGINSYEIHADRAVDMILGTFYNSDIKMIFENVSIDPDTSEYYFDLQSCDGRHLNPGHGLEALWFAMDRLLKKGDEERAKIAANLVIKQLERGWDEKDGGIFYFMDALNKPHEELSWDMKLWWVHNEAILACLYAYLVTGEQKFAEWFYRVDKWTWNRFSDATYGEWYGYLNRSGNPTHTLKGGKWKTFFHLPRCLLKSAQLMEKMALIEKEKNT